MLNSKPVHYEKKSHSTNSSLDFQGESLQRLKISHLAHLEGEYPYLGDLLTMVINHLQY